MKKGWIILLSAFIVMVLSFSMAMAQKEKKPAKKPKAVAVKSGDAAKRGMGEMNWDRLDLIG